LQIPNFMREKVSVLVDRERCTGTLSQTAAMALSSPGAPSTMRSSGRLSRRLMRSPNTVRQAPALSDREQHLLAIGAHAKELTRPSPHLGLKRVDPVVEKIKARSVARFQHNKPLVLPNKASNSRLKH
jgi:hypothetical protein